MTEEEFDRQVGALFDAIEAEIGSQVVSLDGFYQVGTDSPAGRAAVGALAASHGVGIAWHPSLVPGTAVISLILPAGLAD